jgi:hypothetical protein
MNESKLYLALLGGELESGVTYAVPAGSVISVVVNSTATRTTVEEATTVTVGGDDKVVVTVPSLNGRARWSGGLCHAFS